MENGTCISLTNLGKPCTRKSKKEGLCNQHFKIWEKKVNIRPVITITFGDVAENHVRMQKIGKMAEEGFSCLELLKAKNKFEEEGYTTEYIRLDKYLDNNEEELMAAILIVRQGVNALLVNTVYNSDDILNEQLKLTWDKKAKMYGKIVNKKARYNLCYSDESQVADYENGKGTIISFNDIPITNLIRTKLEDYLGETGKELKAEGNMYYNPDACGIGYHGDSERKKVVAIRLGLNIKQESISMPLSYQWYQMSNPVGERIDLNLNHGDLYIMSSKAVGNDWKKKKSLTLRHAAGSERYRKVK